MNRFRLRRQWLEGTELALGIPMLKSLFYLVVTESVKHLAASKKFNDQWNFSESWF